MFHSRSEMHSVDHHHDCGDLRFRREGAPMPSERWLLCHCGLTKLGFRGGEASRPCKNKHFRFDSSRSKGREGAVVLRFILTRGVRVPFPPSLPNPRRPNHSTHGTGLPLPPVGTGAVDSSGMAAPPPREGHVFFPLEERWRWDLLPKGGIGDRCSDRSSGADGGWKDRHGP